VVNLAKETTSSYSRPFSVRNILSLQVFLWDYYSVSRKFWSLIISSKADGDRSRWRNKRRQRKKSFRSHLEREREKKRERVLAFGSEFFRLKQFQLVYISTCILYLYNFINMPIQVRFLFLLLYSTFCWPTAELAIWARAAKKREGFRLHRNLPLPHRRTCCPLNVDSSYSFPWCWAFAFVRRR